MPPIFLLVSAFLINITLSRLIALEREQIGLLKALGYGPLPIAAHYIKIVLVITAVGIADRLRCRRLARAGPDPPLRRVLPLPVPDLPPRRRRLRHRRRWSRSLAAVVGALQAVRDVLALAPAVAMQPPAPHALPPAARRAGWCRSSRSRSSPSWRCATSRAGRCGRGATALGIALGRRPAGDGAALLRLGRADDRRGLLPHRAAAGDAQLHRREARPRPAGGASGCRA